MIDYSKFYRGRRTFAQPWTDRWDLLLSGYNTSDRVLQLFAECPATSKVWLVHPEYGFSSDELDASAKSYVLEGDEVQSLLSVLDEQAIDETRTLAIDITGLMRPHVMSLLWLLQKRNVRHFEVFYSEPTQYKKQEKTEFSRGKVTSVRPVLGFEGVHSPNTDADVLVVGSGYDYQLIQHASEAKRSARKLQMLGLPSLRADMYQENVLRASLAEESMGDGAGRDFFAPANDPFSVAAELRRRIEREEIERPMSNLYLCPLATKPQALGFALYYLLERGASATSIIFPFSTEYSRETSVGCTRIWRYTIELS